MDGADASDAFTAARHAAFATDARAVFDLVRRSTGHTPVHREKVVRGNDNEVYRVTTREGTTFFVRIHRFGEGMPAEEAWAMRLCRDAGVPVPAVRFVGAIESGAGRLKAMVQDAAPGRPLADIAADLRPEQLAHALGQAGRELAQIHSIAVGGFYQYHLDTGWDFPTWDALAASMVENRAKERDLIGRGGFSEDECAEMVRLLGVYREGFACERPVLCHGDYLPGHLFFDDDLRLSGVIDFGMFQGGPTVHDLAVYGLSRPVAQLRLLLRGYGAVGEAGEDFEARLHLHTLALAMGFLAHETRIRDVDSARHTARRLRETLDWCRRRW